MRTASVRVLVVDDSESWRRFILTKRSIPGLPAPRETTTAAARESCTANAPVAFPTSVSHGVPLTPLTSYATISNEKPTNTRRKG